VRRAGIVIAFLVMLTWPAAAETATLQIARPLDLAALPLLIMQHEQLIEHAAEAMGIGRVAVTWSVADGKNGLAALQDGRSDLALADLVPFLAAADSSADTGSELRALAAIMQRPYVLVARNKNIGTIRDFRAGDHIAVPALKFSGPAVMLEMAAAQEWGPEHYAKLDPLVVAQPDAVAADMLLYANGGIDAHFSQTPYVDAELADPAVHRIMDSFDIAGPHSTTVLVATSRFAAANPELSKAVLAALGVADDYIRKSPGAAAEIYAAATKDQGISLEDLSDILGDPDLAYRLAPAGVLHLAQFMQRIGRLKRPVEHWQQFFLPVARDLPGS
jgi:NitT/TauT family transport system substrate-binding protein